MTQLIHWMNGAWTMEGQTSVHAGPQPPSPFWVEEPGEISQEVYDNIGEDEPYKTEEYEGSVFDSILDTLHAKDNELYCSAITHRDPHDSGTFVRYAFKLNGRMYNGEVLVMDIEMRAYDRTMIAIVAEKISFEITQLIMKELLSDRHRQI